MQKQNKINFRVYHWDTFDNETLLMHEAKTLSNAKKWVKKYYSDRIRSTGADVVDIVDSNGCVVEAYNIG